MNRFPRATRVLAEAVASHVAPGAVVEIGTATGPRATLCHGRQDYEGGPPVDADTIYDLASLTKVLCTATLALRLVERGRLGLDDPVRQWIPRWSAPDRAGVTVRHLLEHASGLPDHRRYFESLQGREAFEHAITAEPLEYEPGARSVYSDAGFILLGLAIERAGGAPLDVQYAAWRDEELGRAHMPAFLPPPEWQPRIAPTEQDAWRGRLLRGEVHDENAAALGGVAGHAGLFGTAASVGACARWWMSAAAGPGQAAAFLRRCAIPGSSRALGWDTALPTSSCGTRMTPSAVGHTGFTGTSLWIDPARDLYVVFLSNRVHPSREGDVQPVRRALHDAVADDLTRGG